MPYCGIYLPGELRTEKEHKNAYRQTELEVMKIINAEESYLLRGRRKSGILKKS